MAPLSTSTWLRCRQENMAPLSGRSSPPNVPPGSLALELSSTKNSETASQTYRNANNRDKQSRLHPRRIESPNILGEDCASCRKISVSFPSGNRRRMIFSSNNNYGVGIYSRALWSHVRLDNAAPPPHNAAPRSLWKRDAHRDPLGGFVRNKPRRRSTRILRIPPNDTPPTSPCESRGPPL